MVVVYIFFKYSLYNKCIVFLVVIEEKKKIVKEEFYLIDNSLMVGIFLIIIF